jgi:predicted enzyme related to lactoylglutathione lyase
MNGAQVDLKLEVVVIPVSDVDRAKNFYGALGWRMYADFSNGPDWRVVQMTPPGSPGSIHFGKGITTAAPGSFKNLYLVVADVAAARSELVSRGAGVSEPFHFTAIGGALVPGSTWYAAYVIARERGKTPQDAVEEAALHTQSR